MRIFLLSAIYLFGALSALADPNEVQNLLNSMRFTSDRPDSAMARRTFEDTGRFISRLGEDAVAGMPGGKELIGRHKKMEVYHFLQSKLSDCGPSERNLDQRILDAAKSSDHCEFYERFKDKNISRLAGHWENIALHDKDFLAYGKKKLYHEAVISTASSLWQYERLMGETKSDQERMQNICSKLDDCRDREVKRLLEKELEEFHLTFDERPAPSLREQTNEINQGIRSLNSQLENIPVDVDEDLIFDDPVFTDASRLGHEMYKQSYFHLASQGLGTFLLTESLREKAGGLAAMDSVERESENGATVFKYEPHRELSPRDMREAFKEIKEMTSDQLEELQAGQETSVWETITLHDDQDEINDYIQTYPASSGKALIKNPSLVNFVCQGIQDIESSDQTDKKIKKAAIIGGIVLGTAASLTGVGALITAGIYSGAAAAGSAAAATIVATAGTVASVSFGAGLAIGAVETGYYGTRAYQAHQEYQITRNSLIAQTNDAQGAREMQDAMDDFDNSFNEGLRAGAFTLLDLNGLRLATLGSDVKNITGVTRAKKAVGAVVDAVKSNPKAARVLEIARGIGDATVGKMLNELSKVKAEVTRKFISNLADLSEEQVEAVIRRIAKC